MMISEDTLEIRLLVWRLRWFSVKHALPMAWFALRHPRLIMYWMFVYEDEYMDEHGNLKQV